ncbi:hypothetical protein GIB67_043259, partial [Kingdonia uniflora]
DYEKEKLNERIAKISSGVAVIQIGADIVKRALGYPLKLIAKNIGNNGSVVMEKVLSSDNFKYGYNAATGKYEDLMATGIIDLTKVFFRLLKGCVAIKNRYVFTLYLFRI